ncbi:YaeQ family protein [Stenotrophomonas rhizophila]|uniref:YaeQ family protein n=1 Tax=Stenotrophomonas rhizophila TaxID=216778 RepID=UPI001E5D9BF2|nr:YaeQ family protein [Stenotrophomonas rhizophila]MCC7633575.1 YaeQ family protein [Stenotrophomonas rhizophila]MCC7662940.1 YaeQ family protein [Stenotrophomonas rhizophila]
MALTATIRKAELQISDMDRGYYANHALTLAQHPSETDERLMVRLLAFALNADDRLEFGRGLSVDDEPDLWRRDYTGDIELWIELGAPDESRLRKAAGRARAVQLITYAGRATDIWWERNASAANKLSALEVMDLPAEFVGQWGEQIERTMRWDVMIQDSEVQLISDKAHLTVTPVWRKRKPQA